MALTQTEVALRSLLDQPDTVIFVGSGASLWSGLPNWEFLLRRLLDIAAAKGLSTRLAEEALAGRQLLEAADALPISQLDIATALRIDLGFGAARPHEIHSLLTRLGPQRFVTTNYDSLIEQQLGLDGRLGSFRTVTSRQVAELADIVKASADTFIFKPHGDLSDAQSIVLTTRDYERVIAGETNQVRRTLETLLITRPVLFLGYGMRDPDTGLVLRTIHDRYLGNVGEFTAVVADASSEHMTYWWDRYRIRIHSYATTQPTSGHRDHGALLDLLRRLVEARCVPEQRRPLLPMHSLLGSPNLLPPQVADATVPSMALHAHTDPAALVRYAARLIRPEPAQNWAIQAQLGTWWDTRRYRPEIAAFRNSNLSQILDECPGTFILAGPAGSGKSFAFLYFLSRAGHRLIAWDGEIKTGGTPPIPILLDARLYDGEFAQLVMQTVPSGLDLVAASKSQEIVVIVDSLDEMPAKYLDTASWRADLDLFLTRLDRVRVIYGTRRADLVDQNILPIFNIGTLREEDAQSALADVGVVLESYPEEFRRALMNPFLLTLGRRFLARRHDIRSAPGLVSAFLSDRIAALAEPQPSANLLEHLTDIAAGLSELGRETIQISQIEQGFSAPHSLSHGPPSAVVDQLVSAGVLVSEINAHVRFVHRTVTEYLASGHVIRALRAGAMDLASKLSTYRWDNSISWAISALEEDEAGSLIRAIYQIDAALAFRIISRSEVARVRLWSEFLDLIVQQPPQNDQFFYVAKEVEVPSEMIGRLGQLATKSESLGGWAATAFLRHADDSQLRMWIDRLGAGRVDFNHSNISGPALGSRLSGPIFRYFMDVFVSTKFRDEYDADGKERHDEIVKRHGFEAVIGGLAPAEFDSILAWAATQTRRIRGIICSSLLHGDRANGDEFLRSQLGEGIDQARFAAFLRLRHAGGDEHAAAIPQYSKRSLQMLLKSSSRRGDRQNWGIRLLPILARRNSAWLQGLNAAANTASEPAIRRSLKALSPTSSVNLKRAFISRALRNPLKLSALERDVLKALADEPIAIPEDTVLEAIRRNGRAAIELIEDFFRRYNDSEVSISGARVDDWVALLQSIYPLHEVDQPTNICQYLAAAFSDLGRERVLERANDPTSEIRKFVLTAIVPHMTTVTTDDLTPETALLMVDLFLQRPGHWLGSPGLIASDRFVSNQLMPLARNLPEHDPRRAKMEQILRDAGRRHDRRYLPY